MGHESRESGDARLETMLEQALPQSLPEDIVRGVTPWRKILGRILAGLALNMITLQFLLLQYLLPLVGSILLVLGFRALRQENRWLRWGWYLSLSMLALQMASLWANSAVWQERDDVLLWMTLAHMGLQLAQLRCLWRGLCTLREKAGLPGKAGGAGALLLWYDIVCVLALTNVGGWLVMIPLLITYGLILYSLHRLSGTLEEAGYAIVPAPVRVSDGTVAGIVTGMLAIGLALCFLFAGKYPMDWQPRDTVQSTDAGYIAAQLTELGFPEDLLADLTEEELLLCADAREVVVQREEYPMNDGRSVVVQEDNRQVHTTVYDQKELQVTHVAVRLEGERERWRIFHRFFWTEDAAFPGTEAIQLWTAGQYSEGWMDHSAITGRVLCSMDGQDWAAEYAILGRQSYTSQSIFWGAQQKSDPFAAFSFPRSGTQCRGYLTYEIAEAEEGWLVNSWMNYVHQVSALQYPVYTAMEARMLGKIGSSTPFRMAQTALQFNPLYPQQPLE